MNLEQFLDKQGPYLHVRLLKYYYLSTSEEEQSKQKDTDTLFFDFEEGRYGVNFLVLKEKADEETKELLAKKPVQKQLKLPKLNKLNLT